MTHTEHQLRQAYKSTGLALLGYTYQQAISTPAIAIGLANIVESRTRQQKQPAPAQTRLDLTAKD